MPANMLSLVFIGIRLEQEFGFGMHLDFWLHVCYHACITTSINVCSKR